jgi:hypothetical protein
LGVESSRTSGVSCFGLGVIRWDLRMSQLLIAALDEFFQ